MSDVLQPQMPFDHRYDVYRLLELPSGPVVASEDVIYFPSQSRRGGRDGIIVRVIPADAPPWIGVFAFSPLRRSFSAIVSSPDPARFFVVSRGAGYNVISDSRMVEDVPLTPIQDLIVFPTALLVVMVSTNSLISYDGRGVRWLAHVSSDGLIITPPADEKTLGGFGFDPATGEKVPFSVDVASGQVTGGPPALRYEPDG